MTSNAFGRVDSENNVFVIEAGVERLVGQYPNVSEADALAYFVRKYQDLEAQVRILEQRLASGVTDAKSLKAAYDHLVEELKEPKAVGNLVSLRERLAKTEPAISSAAEKPACAAVGEVACRSGVRHLKNAWTVRQDH